MKCSPRRYGPLVFGVCRRVLRDSHAAEDAFQATFLVLMRKAPALVCCQRLGGWLYRVAYRLALRACANEARRRQREAQAARSDADAESHVSNPSDLIVALEEELQKLPEKHRVPLVLCYLEGKSNEQAAQVLGCPRGSISARLTQARERLRACLARRGYAVPSAGVAAVLTSAAAEAAVPLPLLSNTVARPCGSPARRRLPPASSPRRRSRWPEGHARHVREQAEDRRRSADGCRDAGGRRHDAAESGSPGRPAVTGR